jgi:putative ABC transport system substrate-binding protein
MEAADVRALRPGATDRIDGIVVPAEPWLVHQARPIVEVAAKLKLPAVYPFSEFVEEGGLVAYGPNLRALYRRAGAYVARVLAGVRPRDLPIERPSRSELMVNVRTARALGITLPPALLAAADRIIE